MDDCVASAHDARALPDMSKVEVMSPAGASAATDVKVATPECPICLQPMGWASIGSSECDSSSRSFLMRHRIPAQAELHPRIKSHCDMRQAFAEAPTTLDVAVCVGNVASADVVDTSVVSDADDHRHTSDAPCRYCKRTDGGHDEFCFLRMEAEREKQRVMFEDMMARLYPEAVPGFE